jgi:hypothetical protein
MMMLSAFALLLVQGVWSKETPLTTGTYSLGAAVVDGKLYAISGAASQRVECFDPETSSWTLKSPLPGDDLLQYFGLAEVGGRLYVVAGDTGWRGQRASNLEYDPATDVWTPRAELPGGPRWSLVAAAVDGRIYALGGRLDSIFLDRNECYDPVLDQWSARAPIPTPRDAVVAAVIDGRIHLVGGHDATGEIFTIHVYDPATDAWSVLPSPLPAYHSNGVVLGHRLFMMGRGSFTDLRVHVFDATTGIWSEAAEMSGERNDFGLAADVERRRIHAIGGYRPPSGGHPGAILNLHEVLDPDAVPPALPPPPGATPPSVDGDARFRSGDGDDEDCALGAASASPSLSADLLLATLAVLAAAFRPAVVKQSRRAGYPEDPKGRLA